MNKVVSKSIFAFAISSIFALSFVSIRSEKNSDTPKFAPKGMVAYAASYSTDPTGEPKYTTQNSTTFQYLNLGSTLSAYRGDSVKVGIIDSGINYDHEDFMVNGSTKVEGDSKYYSYQGSSWVYYGASSHGYSYIDDTLGHGTNVAATVAAAINSVGGIGLAPNVELYVYKVTNSSNGYEFGAIQNALMDAKTLKLDVINMSFQSYEHSVTYNGSTMAASSGCSSILTYYLNQAYNAGITLVGAAGNYNTDEPSYPGSNNHVINVGSLNSTGTGKAGFSNYGSTIDLVAPGYVYVADEASNTAYTNTQGTSFSAPLVTAAIALYKQKNPNATPSQIESALYASCDEIDDSGSSYTNWAGNGSLNIAKFLGVEEDCPTEVVINNPEIVDEELTLEVGETFDLDWTVNGVGTFDDSVSIYPLEDNGTLSVDSNGHITALATGSDYVVIESNADSDVYASVYVTVNPSSHTPGEVYEYQESESILGTITYTTEEVISDKKILSTSKSGYTTVEDNSLRLGSSSNTGSITVTSTSSNIYKVVVSAKSYGSDSSVHLTVGGDDKTLTNSYTNYEKSYKTPTNSVSIATTADKKRANIESISIYTHTSILVDISDTADCLGLEVFIDTYMHMDYIDNLGYCKDSEHHYYSSAKTAFNTLNEHQRSLFTTNDAYKLEFARLSAWASANGETINNNLLIRTDSLPTLNDSSSSGAIVVIIAVTMSLSTLVLLLVLKKKKNN